MEIGDNERGRCCKNGDSTSRTPQLRMDFVSFHHVPSAHIFILLTESVCYGSVSALLAFLTVTTPIGIKGKRGTNSCSFYHPVAEQNCIVFAFLHI